MNTKRVNIIVVLCVVMLCAACQPTPEELIVQNKADGELMDKIEATAVILKTAEYTEAVFQESENTNIEETTVLEDGYIVIAHEEFEQTLVNGMNLVVDADVIIPDSLTFPAIKFQRKEFTQEDIDNVLYTLIGDKPLYEPELPMTKTQIEEIIIKLQLKLTESGLSEERINKINSSIEEWKARHETAPEEADLIEISRQMDENYQVVGKAQFNDYLYSWVYVLAENPSRTNFDDSSIGIRYSILGKDNTDSLWTLLQGVRNMKLGELSDTSGTYDGKTLEPVENAEGIIEMTPEEAIKLAEDTFHSLGAGDDVRVSEIFYLYIPEGETNPAEDIHCYAIELKRYIGDTPIQVAFSYNQGMEQRSNDGSDVFNSNMPYECMSVFISDDGIIDLEWREPMEVVEVINENVELVDYETIIEVFKQEFVNSYSTFFWRTEQEYVENEATGSALTYEPYSDCELYSIKMSYGMARIPNQDGYYMAIPLWDFYASYTWKTWSGYTATTYEENSGTLDFGMMTINAIDNSRFSRQWGY